MMDVYFERNKLWFRECVSQWEDKDKYDVRSLYIKDLNLARTLLLWIYPPFIEEFNTIYDLRPKQQSSEPNVFPGFGQNDYATLMLEWERERKAFHKRWNIKMKPEHSFTITHLDKIIYPILFAKKNEALSSKEINFIPCSDFPAPVRAISKGHERTMSRIHDSAPIQSYEITLTVDTRWSTSDISKEISKYVKDYQRLYCEKINERLPNLTSEEILKDLHQSLHPKVKKCPQKLYYEYFYKFVEKNSYQAVADHFDMTGDEARSTISKAINWVIEFLDYDIERGQEWAKRHTKKT